MIDEIIKIKACFCCGSTHAELIWLKKEIQVCCISCGARSSREITTTSAIVSWNTTRSAVDFYSKALLKIEDGGSE